MQVGWASDRMSFGEDVHRSLGLTKCKPSCVNPPPFLAQHSDDSEIHIRKSLNSQTTKAGNEPLVQDQVFTFLGLDSIASR